MLEFLKDKAKCTGCGAAWNGLEVQYQTVLGVDNISPLCRSKYVQSNPMRVFKDIKNHLESGKKAIFCGTPCSVAGLNAFLGKAYPYTVKRKVYDALPVFIRKMMFKILRG